MSIFQESKYYQKKKKKTCNNERTHVMNSPKKKKTDSRIIQYNSCHTIRTYVTSTLIIARKLANE